MINRQDSIDLAKKILSISDQSEPIEEFLSTDEKVIARITDGIYRQPASALRELISNAYDADATSVTIDTDYPRFEKITIRDNGMGMSANTLANMIKHIGGSAKRDGFGVDLGITDKNDCTKTNAGRKIIGKIGIGLFSVAQLTQQFKIITKVKGESYRLVADVTLRTFSENASVPSVKSELTNTNEINLVGGDQKGQKDQKENSGADKFRSGLVRISKIPAVDVDSQGTDIVLFNLRKNAISILRSQDIWDREGDDFKTPSYHIGQYNLVDNFYIEVKPMRLPWKDTDNLNQRFLKMYSALLDEFDSTHPTPSLENTFDQYFRTIWSLALSSPIEYIQKHPFKLDDTDEPNLFVVANNRSGHASELVFDEKERNYQEFAGTSYPKKDPLGGFDVYVDGLKLFRPVAFNKQKKTNNALKTPLMFYGKYKTDMSALDERVTGGDLEFEAYFYWNSKILPLEHNGVSIRINNASGTAYDKTWLGYSVAELTTLGQITAEVFVTNGLDAALNIDRESFNYAHPHYQILSKWVHNALRQITKKQKDLRRQKNSERNIAAIENEVKALHELSSVQKARAILDDFPEFSVNSSEVVKKREVGVSAYHVNNSLFQKVSETQRERFKLIVSILESNDLLAGLSYAKREEIINDIAEVFFGV